MTSEQARAAAAANAKLREKDERIEELENTAVCRGAYNRVRNERDAARAELATLQQTADLRLENYKRACNESIRQRYTIDSYSQQLSDFKNHFHKVAEYAKSLNVTSPGIGESAKESEFWWDWTRRLVDEVAKGRAELASVKELSMANALRDFKSEMENKVIPEIVETMRQRAKAANLHKDDVLMSLQNEQEAHAAWQKRAEEAEAELATTKDELERERVRLAGCSVAALGYAKGENAASPNAYGYSVSYQDVCDLREKYEQQKAGREGWEADAKVLAQSRDEWQRKYEELAELRARDRWIPVGEWPLHEGDYLLGTDGIDVWEVHYCLPIGEDGQADPDAELCFFADGGDAHVHPTHLRAMPEPIERELPEPPKEGV